jgi:hypothetical protein
MTGPTSTGGGYSGGYGGSYGGYGSNGTELSDEEKELIAAQTAALKRQTAVQEEMYALHKTLLPMQFKQLGYDLTYDDKGNITGYTANEQGKKREELDAGYLDRQLKALRGELPISPALEESLNRQETTLRDRMTQQLGPGWETSSAGIEALQDFNTARTGLEEDVRQGVLTGGEALSLGRGADVAGRSGALQATAQGTPGTIAQLFGNVAQGYAQAVQPLTQSRIAANQLQAQMQIAQMNNQASLQAAQMGSQGGMSSLLPLLLAGGGGFSFSDKRMKTDIADTGMTMGEYLGMSEHADDVDIEGAFNGKSARDVPVKTWRYKSDPPGTVRTGPMAQDVEKAAPGAVVKGPNGMKMIHQPTLVQQLRASRDRQIAASRADSDNFLRNIRAQPDTFAGTYFPGGA